MKDSLSPPLPASAPRSHPDEGRCHGYLLVALAFVIYLGLLSYRLGEREFWIDEQITVGHLGEDTIHFDAFHPPGYYRWLLVWRGLFGESDAALRAFSVLCAMIAALFVWLLARQLLPRPYEMLGLWLFVLSPVGLLYFRMARYFSLTAAVALFAAWAAVVAKRQGKPGYVLLALATLHMMWTDFVPLVLMPLLYLWLLPTAWRRGRERYWWLASAAAPLALGVWQAERMLAQARMVASIPAPHPALKQVLLSLALPFYSAVVGETTDFWRLWIVLPVLVAGIALGGVGLTAAIRNRPSRSPDLRWLSVLAWPLAVIVAAAVVAVISSEPWPRVVSLCLYALPFFLFWVVLGVVRLKRWGWALLAVLLCGQLYGVSNYLARRQFLNPGYNIPWREVNALIQERGHPGDTAVACFDSTPGRYWIGPVHFHDLVEDRLPPQIPGVRDFPTGDAVWVIDRDRGSGIAREQTARLIEWLRARTVREEVYQILPYSAVERHWRSRLGGHEVPAAAVRIWRFEGAASR